MATSDDKIDDATLSRILDAGVSPEGYKRRTLQSPPVNTMGIHQLLAYEVPALANSNASGFVLSKQTPGDKSRIYLEPGAGKDVIAHETEHLLAQQGLGTASKINTQFDTLIKRPEARDAFVKAAIDAAPYLKEKYGLTNAYFDPKMYQYQGPLAKNLLYEQLASLASVEAAQGVNLLDDPVLRKTLFKDKDVRETYNALTGLRQTRLDARDLPPHTRQPEKAQPQESTSAVSRLKKLLGMAEGGRVDAAGRNKLI